MNLNNLKKAIAQDENKIADNKTLIKKYKKLAAAVVVELEMVRGGYASDARRNLRKSSIINGLEGESDRAQESIARCIAAIDAENVRFAAIEDKVDAISETAILNGETVNINEYLRSIGC